MSGTDLYTLEQLAELVDGRLRSSQHSRPILSVSHVANRTRPGSACFTVDAYRRNAVVEAQKAVRKGASCIVTSTPAVNVDVPVILVGDPGAAHWRLATRNRLRFSGRLVGITGSVGKTSTKDMLAHILRRAGSVQATKLNQNRTAALVSQIASIRPDTDFVVSEISMVEPGTIQKKAQLARPDIAVVTAIDYSHAGNHDAHPSWILDEKVSIFDGLGPNGIAVIPSFGEHASAIRDAAAKRAARIISCGEMENDDVRLRALETLPGGSRVEFIFEGQSHKFTIGQPGRHLVRNALLCAAATIALGADPAHLDALARYRPTPSRMQRIRVTLSEEAELEVIDDSYNAAPASVSALLDYLSTRTDAGRRMLVLGDMLELGDRSEELHLSLVPLIQRAGVDTLIAVGEQMRAVSEACQLPGIWKATSGEAAPEIAALIRPGDLVAVKASNSMNMDVVVAALRDRGQSVRTARPDWGPTGARCATQRT